MSCPLSTSARPYEAALQVNKTAMEALIEQCRSDIRLVLNTLQVWPKCRMLHLGSSMTPAHHAPPTQMRRLNADTLRFDDVRGIGTKDLELGAFSAADGYASRDIMPTGLPLSIPFLCRLMQPDHSRYMSINDRMNLVYQDSDIIPLFIQVRAAPC